MGSRRSIGAEIESRLGFIPPFFEAAFGLPRVLENLWYQTKTAYLDNPLPDLFKEKLAALLARDCQVSYCLVCHTSLDPETHKIFLVGISVVRDLHRYRRAEKVDSGRCDCPPSCRGRQSQ